MRGPPYIWTKEAIPSSLSPGQLYILDAVEIKTCYPLLMVLTPEPSQQRYGFSPSVYSVLQCTITHIRYVSNISVTVLLNCGVGENSWESLGLQGDPTSPFWRRSVLGVHWKDRCWSWNSNTLATSCEELTHLKRPWCWERLRAGGEGDDRGWDGWMASPTQWPWVWVNSGSWWWTGTPGVLQFMGSERAGHNWATELNWTEY